MTDQVGIVSYFGYGVTRDAELMSVLCGRPMQGTQVVLQDYDLIVQGPKDLPLAVASLMIAARGKDYKAYRVRPAKGKTVVGTLWMLTEEEHEIVKTWELNGDWTQTMEGQAIDDLGKFYSVVTDGVGIERTGEVVNGICYKDFLNPREDMLVAAGQDRALYFLEKARFSGAERQ